MEHAVATATRPPPAGGTSSLTQRTGVLFAFRELVNARSDELAAVITAEHGKVLADAAGRCPRPGGRRVRLRDPAPAQGRLHRAGLHRRRRLLDPPAARRRRRHHAVQLPGDGAAVDVPDRDRLRQRGSCSSRARRTRRRRCCWPAAGRRPGCPTASSTSCRATRKRSTRCSTTPTSRPCQLRRLHADRRLRLRDRHRARQAGAGARRREEPHGGAARRRPRPRRRRAVAALRLGGRALHGDLGRRGGRRR